MELRRFLHSIIRMFWLIILLAVLGGGITAYILNYSKYPMYSADTTVYTLNKGSSVDYQNILISRQLINDYKDIIKSEKVITMTEKEVADLKISQRELKDMISISSQDNSSIIVISAVSDDAKVAAKVSKAVTKCFISTLNEMTETNIIGVIDEAKEPTVPLSNSDTKIIILGTALGIGLAILIIYIIDFFDTTVRFYEDIEHYTKLSIIGVIPKYGIK